MGLPSFQIRILFRKRRNTLIFQILPIRLYNQILYRERAIWILYNNTVRRERIIMLLIRKKYQKEVRQLRKKLSDLVKIISNREEITRKNRNNISF